MNPTFSFCRNPGTPSRVSYFCAMRKKRAPLIWEGIEVKEAGAKGKSIAEAPDGKTVLITHAVPGDRVTVRVTKKKRRYWEARTITVEKPSPFRVKPRCAHFGVCGGCKWQQTAYERQLAFKQEEVSQNLARIGQVEPQELLPILGAPEHFNYRNKMEFSFSSNRWLTEEEMQAGIEEKERNGLGFHLPGMWDKILDLKECHLQAEPSNQIRLFIRNYCIENGLEFFNPRSQEGLLRTLMIRNSSLGQWMVLIQFYREEKEKREALLNALTEKFPEISALLYVINPKANDTLYDLEVHCFAGKGYIEEEMEGLRFKIQPKSFYQTNSEQAYNLYKIVREFANLQGDELVYDLYTGTGTIAQFVAKQAGKVIGIESVPDAIDDARENALNNQIANVEFTTGDMKEVFTAEFLAKHGHPEVVITDPPRDGMHKKVVEQLLQAAPERIVYVSCNSATQARDLEMLKEAYTLVKSQAVDLFPHTHHIENVVLLERC